jgi:hypothetical protein
MGVNFKKFLLDYGLFAIIIVAMLALLPPVLTPMLGSVLGQYTSYIITAIIAMAALWIHRVAKKEL